MTTTCDPMPTGEPNLTQLVRTNQLDRLAAVLTAENVNTRDPEGYSLLHQAAQDLNVEAARLLVARGADVNATDRHQDTALHYAADRNPFVWPNSLHLAQLLIEAGADPNRRGQYGMTPLHWAISQPAVNWELVRYLLSHGADPRILSENGSSAMAVAVRRYPKFAEELKRQYSRPDPNPA